MLIKFVRQSFPFFYFDSRAGWRKRRNESIGKGATGIGWILSFIAYL